MEAVEVNRVGGAVSPLFPNASSSHLGIHFSFSSSRYLPFTHHPQAYSVPSLSTLDVPIDVVQQPTESFTESLSIVSLLSSTTRLLLTPLQPVNARDRPRRILNRGRDIILRLNGVLRAPFSRCTRSVRNAIAHLRHT